MYCLCFLLWSVPNFLVHPGGFLAIVFRHSSNGENFAAIRVGQQALQGSHPAPSVCLRCLHDARLESANLRLMARQSMAYHSAASRETAPTACAVVICIAS